MPKKKGKGPKIKGPRKPDHGKGEDEALGKRGAVY